MTKFQFLNAYQLTILSIIEQNQKIRIPRAGEKLIILISFVQIAMYLFRDFKLENSDERKLQSVFSISQMVSIVNVLNTKQNDSLSLTIIIITQSFQILYFIYVALLTITQQYLQELYKKFELIIIQINKLLNLYFTVFLNILLTEYIELNCSVLFCCSRSLFSDQRSKANSSQCSIPIWQTIIGTIGIIMTVLNTIIISYYFRNQGFLETNSLKRKYTKLFLIQITIRIIIPFIDFNEKFSSALTLKHLLCQAYGIISLIDYFHSIPFSDFNFSQFYLIIVAYYQCIVYCSSFLILSNMINGSDMFYMCIIIGLISSVFLQQAQSYFYETILTYNWKSSQNITRFNCYLEQICSLGEKCDEDDKSKIILQKSYLFHRNTCKISTCFCQVNPTLNIKIKDQIQSQTQNNSIDQNYNDNNRIKEKINQQLIISLIDTLFQWMLNHKVMKEYSVEYEQLSLKYISFLIKYDNNPVCAYYELKILKMKKKQLTLSLYYKMITQIIENKIENILETKNQQYNSKGQSNEAIKINNQSKEKDIKNQKMVKQLNIKTLVIVEGISQQFLPQFLIILDLKFDLLVKLQNGYQNLNLFQNDALKLMSNINKLNIVFNQLIKSHLKNNPDILNNFQFQKLKQIYYLFIQNDFMQAINIEFSIKEIEKEQTQANTDSIKSSDYLRGDICILEVSLSRNLGQIVSRINEKTASFFGYSSLEDFKQVNCINQLMPSFISKVHNQMMENYIKNTSYQTKNSQKIVTSFIKKCDGYIFPVQINFGYSFTPSDFRLNGILVKARVEAEFIVFHRSGKVTGMTKGLAEILLQEFHRIPEGEIVTSRLNALLMFPKIIKMIIQKKNDILETLNQKLKVNLTYDCGQRGIDIQYQSNAYTMTNLIEKAKGSITFDPNPFSIQQNFMNYLQKKEVKINQNKQLKYEDIDILDEQILQIYKQFKTYEFEINSKRNSKPGAVFVPKRYEKGEEQVDDYNMVNDKQFKAYLNKYNQEEQIKYQMNFDYQVEYCYLNSNKKCNLQQQEENIKIFKNSLQKNKNQDIYLTDIYFQVKFTNIATKQKLKKLKETAYEVFVKNLAQSLLSTTSILQFSNSLSHSFAFKQDNTNEVFSKASEVNQHINLLQQETTEQNPTNPLSNKIKFRELPKKMIETLQTELSQKRGNRFQLQLKILKRIHSNIKYINSSDEQKSNVSLSGYESDTDYERLYNQIHCLQSSKKQQETESCKIESLIRRRYLLKVDVLALDPKFKVKRLLQTKCLSIKFIQDLEFAFVDEFLQLQDELKNQQEYSSRSLFLESDIQIEKRDAIDITFREEPSAIYNLELGSEKIPQNNLAIVESQTNRIAVNKLLIGASTDTNQVSEKQQCTNDYDSIQCSIEQQLKDFSPLPRIHNDINLNLEAFNSSIIQIFSSVTDQENQKPSAIEATDNLKCMNEPLINQTQQVSFVNQGQSIMQNQCQQEQETNKLSFVKRAVEEKEVNSFRNARKEITTQILFRRNTSFFQCDNKSTQNADEEGLDSQKLTEENVGVDLFQKTKRLTDNNVRERSSLGSFLKNQHGHTNNILKEIILNQYIPSWANKYKLILFIFLISFIGLNIISLNIIENDITVFSNNVAILRQPHKLLTDFGKACFGFYLSLEYQLGFLSETDGSVQAAFNQYMSSAVSEYNSLIQQYSTQLMSLGEQLTVTNSDKTLTYQVFVQRLQEEIQVKQAFLFVQQQYYVMGVSHNFTTQVRDDSFLYLRENYFNFSGQVQNTVNFLVDDTINSVDTLISYLTVVILIAIIGIVFIGIISLPIIKIVNAYEEKILLIVSRMEYDTSELEKCKISVCKQLINIEQNDWLGYNYFNIYGMQVGENQKENQMSKSKIGNPMFEQLSTLENKNNPFEKERINRAIDASGAHLVDGNSFIQLKSDFQEMIKHMAQKQSRIKQRRQFKQPIQPYKKPQEKLEKQPQIKKNKVANYEGDTVSHSQKVQKNYLLSSKIETKSLTVFNRFLTLFVLTILNCIYFLVIIVYITSSDASLKIPIQMNQRGINLHIIMTNLKIASELLAFDFYIEQYLWPDYQITGLQSYYDSMNASIVTLTQIQQQNSNIIYGSNPFPSSMLKQIQDLQQGQGCQYLVIYPCQSYNENLGIQQIITDKIKFIQSYQDVLNPIKTQESELVAYLNDNLHLSNFVFSFLSEDELFDVYNTLLNQSISTVSIAIESFLYYYIIIAGCLISFILFIVLVLHWKQLLQRIQFMNLLLSIIPQDKLEEEITLQILSQIHKM